MRKLIATYTTMFVLLLAGAAAQAQLRIEITSGVTDPIPIAIVPFARGVAGDQTTDIAAIVQNDLDGCGRFRTMARGRMPATPGKADEVQLGDWKNAGNDYVVVGRSTVADGGVQSIDFDLINVLTGQRMASQRVTAATARSGAHRVADVLYEKILGVRGAFATRIAYVAVDGQPPQQHYQLVVADSDGENPRMVLESKQPIMSPAWSADGQWLAYVSFENKRSSIYVQKIKTGERRQVAARAGINGAPAWSPDGRKLALTLGGSSGNADIYVLDLYSQALTRITDDPAIDTEAVWSADGQSLYFTSDRAGGPQVYMVAAQTGARPKRVSFGGSYNARPRLSPDGKQLAMVTIDQSAYRIAVQDLATGTVRVLSKGHLDESPSFAPNGAMLIYAGSDRGQNGLLTVSTDGLTGQRLHSDRGQVREPVWGPFLE